MKKNNLSRFFLPAVMVSSLVAFLLVNNADQLPAIVRTKLGNSKDSTKTEVQILPDVALFQRVWERGKGLLPKIGTII